MHKAMHQSSCAMSIKTEGCWGSPEMGLLSQNRCRPLHKPTCRKRDMISAVTSQAWPAVVGSNPQTRNSRMHKAMHQSSCAMSIKTEGCWGSPEMGLLS